MTTQHAPSAAQQAPRIYQSANGEWHWINKHGVINSRPCASFEAAVIALGDNHDARLPSRYPADLQCPEPLSASEYRAARKAVLHLITKSTTNVLAGHAYREALVRARHGYYVLGTGR